MYFHALFKNIAYLFIFIFQIKHKIMLQVWRMNLLKNTIQQHKINETLNYANNNDIINAYVFLFF